MGSNGIARIEMDYMNSVCSMNRKMRDQREIDWEQRRYEIAKDIFTGLLAHGDGDVRSFSHGNLQMTAADCVREANALIEELKKGGLNGKIG